MTHTLRKYLSNRGSALFMVLSTMTALLIAVMAMYFSILSSRTVQYTVFNQEQSYQSAVSLLNALTANTDAGPMANVFDKIVSDSFNIGDSISTNGSGFAAFGGTADDQNNVGAYDVTITRIEDEFIKGTDGSLVQVQTYDIAATVSVNGVMETVHTFIHAQPLEGNEAVASSDIFASTGYVPNNTYISYGYYYTQSVYDNEFTLIGVQTNGGFTMDDLACGGSLEVNKVVSSSSGRSMTWIVRDTLYKRNNQGFTLGNSATDKGALYVGGDLYITNGGKISNTDVYVLGDMHIKNSPSYENTTFHIRGDLIVDDTSSMYSLPGTSIVNIGGSVINSMPGVWINGKQYQVGDAIEGYAGWDTDDSNAIADYIDSKTQDHDFQKWEIPASKWNGHKVEIQFNSSNTEASNNPLYELTWSGTGKEQYADITDIVDLGDASYTNYTVIIDTGDDPENVYYLRLNANKPLNGWAGGQVKYSEHPDDAFSWMPTRTTGAGLDRIRKQVSGKVNVIYKGQGSVVCFIPNGVSMVAEWGETVIHEGWLDIVGATRTGNVYTIPQDISPDTIADHIHQECGNASCNCDYKTKVLTSTCDKCGQPMTELTCEKHSYKRVFCTNESCDACKRNAPAKVGGAYKELCNNRIDKTTFSAGAIIPNVNFFLVSCDESAEIYISSFPDESGNASDIKENKFFGFIYAPYMTYKGIGSSGGSKIRFCGGMVVSDYILLDDYSYVNCYPTLMPEELGANQGTLSHADKSWKISIARN